MCNRTGKDNLLTDIKRACDILKNGGVILYPTDTIWGIGCDVKNEQAIKRIYTIKQRTNAKSMLILVNSIEMLCRYIESVPPVALKILEHEIDIFNQPNDNKQERPITIIYPQAKGVSPLSP